MLTINQSKNQVNSPILELENPKEKLERELTKPELIHYYYQRLGLITDPHLRANPNTKDFPEVKTDPQKFAAFDIAVELHRAGSRPWVG